MVKSEYFCDRCKVKVTSQFSLRPVQIHRRETNALRIDVCDSCSDDIYAMLFKPLPVLDAQEPDK